MKKRILGFLAVVIFLQVVSLVAAENICDLSAIMLNQDPYPVAPGETVKVIFQVDGSVDSNCGKVSVVLKEAFPFKLDAGYDPTYTSKSGIYLRDFESFLLVPYKLIVNKDAVDGENKLKIDLISDSGTITKSFNIEVADLRTDFEVSVKDYDKSTQTITFEILNSGEHDVEALTIDIPQQESISVRGSYRNIIGALDSNDDTTFNFEATPTNGDLKLIITYTDGINERRIIEKIVSFNMDNFNGRATEKQGMSIWFYITIILAIGFIFYWYRGRKAQKRRRERHRN